MPRFGHLKIAAALAGLFALSSCLTLNEHVAIHADGSGVVQVSYRIARLARELPSSGSIAVLPLPTSPESFSKRVRGVQGLRLESFKPIEATSAVGADASIAFNRVTSLDSVLGPDSGVTFQLNRNGSLFSFRQTIYPGNPDGVDKKTLDLVKELFGDDKLVFSLAAPARIRSVNLGTIGSDRTTASYSTTVPAVIQAKKPVVWEVSW